MIPSIIFLLYQHFSQKYSTIKRIKDSGSSFLAIDYIFLTVHNFQYLVYNIFIAGLAFNSVISIIGMILNPSNVISVSGFFYLLGILIFAVVLFDAIQSFSSSHQQCNKLRVVVKAFFMGIMFISPISIFAGMVAIDISMMIFEYKVKLKRWAVPKLWLFNQIICLISYAALIFLPSMQLGIIIVSILIVVVILFDSYLHYK
jgi:hypothetical protein